MTESLPHVRGRQVAPRQLFLKRLLGNVLSRLGVCGIELFIGQLNLQLGGLRHQDLLDDDLVEEGELGGERLFVGEVLRRPARSADMPFRRIARNLATVNGRPGVGVTGLAAALRESSGMRRQGTSLSAR